MNTQERIDIIKKIMQRKEPPFDENDIYYERKPWKKFGAVCDTGSIGVGWCWYKVSVILSKVTDEELVLALEEIENVNMTIEEAIAQLKDLRKDREGFLENDEPDSEFAKDIEAIDVAVKALEENSKLKRLLRLAVDDIAWSNCNMGDSDECPDCPYYSGKPGRCLNEWKHAEEVLELLGDDDNGQ